MKQFLKSAFAIILLLNNLEIIAKSYSSSDDNSQLKAHCVTGPNQTCLSSSTNYSPSFSSSSSSSSSSGSSSACSGSSSSSSSSSSSVSSCNSSCGSSCDTCNFGRNGIHYRSQGANTARELVGWQWEINRPFMCQNYGATYAAFEYQRSFKSKHIARSLFGESTLHFAGSQVSERRANALIADNFGLSRDFVGSIKFRPRIENYILDLGLYIGLDSCVQNLYLRFHMPIVFTRWQLRPTCYNNCCDPICSITGAGVPFDPCYVSSTPAKSGIITVPGHLPSSTIIDHNLTFSSAVRPAHSAQSIEQALSGNFLFGDMKTEWCSGRFSRRNRSRFGVADIDVILGYNFLSDDCYHLGFYLQAVMPTGNKRNDLFVFDPIVGNGGHFELGLGISAHQVLWTGECSNLAFFFEGNVTHMFRSRQCRLFDFCNGFLTRYLLLKEFDVNGTTATYNGNLISATCFNNRRVDVRLDIKGDASIKLAYRWCEWGIDLGYNVYGQTHEVITRHCQERECKLNNRSFGIKGTEGVCCFNYPIAIPTGETASGAELLPAGFTFTPGIPGAPTAPSGCPTLTSPITVTALPDNNTQPMANAFIVINTSSAKPVASDCSVCLASNSNQITEPTALTDIIPANGFIVVNRTRPMFVGLQDINLKSAEAPAALTHKFFAHINYTWADECGYDPHIGIGGEIEVESTHDRKPGRSAHGPFSCRRTAVNQWGVWIKGGFSF